MEKYIHRKERRCSFHLALYRKVFGVCASMDDFKVVEKEKFYGTLISLLFRET